MQGSPETVSKKVGSALKDLQSLRLLNRYSSKKTQKNLLNCGALRAVAHTRQTCGARWRILYIIVRSDIFESRIHSTFCPVCLKEFVNRTNVLNHVKYRSYACATFLLTKPPSSNHTQRTRAQCSAYDDVTYGYV